MPFIVGGLVAGSAIIGAMGSASQNKAQAIAAQMQQQQQNFQNRWQNEAQNRNLLRQWQAQVELNKSIEQGAVRGLARQKVYSKKAYENMTSELSKQTRQANSAFLGMASARGVSQDSASVRAMMRQATKEAVTSQANLRNNYRVQQEDLQTQYKNILSQRKLGGPEQVAFLEQRGAIVDSSSSMLMSGIASGLLSGAAAGVSAYNQTGYDNSLSAKLGIKF